MKNQQKEEAKNMYFHEGSSKTEIAGKLGVTRKTVLLWAQQGNWDALKMSSIHMPSLVAEKCYYLLDQYASHLLTDGTPISNFSLKDAQALHLLASTIKKLKNRSSVNESMEMFNFFMDGLNRRNPALAEQVAPQIEEYIAIRKNIETTDFLLEGINQDGTIPYPVKETDEKNADKKEYQELMQDFELFMSTRPAKNDLATQPLTSEIPLNKDAANDPLANDQTQLNEAA